MRISDWSSDVCSSDLCLMPAGAGCSAPASQFRTNQPDRAPFSVNSLGLLPDIPVAQLRKRDTVRLLPSRFADQEASVLAPLAEDAAQLNDLFDLDKIGRAHV